MIVTITAYNKTVIAGGFGGTLAGADPAYLVKRGYAQLTVDARGTGSLARASGTRSTRARTRTRAEVMTWAHTQPWSNGSTAMTGASYMGISQIFAAAGQPAGLKAIFPQVPGADVYRDVVASGGQIDVGLHAAVARAGHGDRPDPAGRRRRPTRSRRIGALDLAHRRGRHLHRADCCSRRWPAATRRTTGRSTRSARRST